VNAPEAIAARLIGSLFVERGLVSESQLRVALELQRETGEQLGQILVSTFGVSRKELARVVADQWREMSGDAGADPERSARRRPLGEIFITRGFVSEEELDAALRRQRKTGERLGEALVGLGVISKFELAGALGEQMAELQEAADAEAAELAVVVDMPQREPEETTFGTLAEPDEPEGESHADGSYELLPENDAALEDEGPSPVVGRLEEALAPMRRDEADASDGSDSDVTWPTVASFDDFAEPERGVAEPDVAEPAPVADGIDDLIVAVAETEPDVVEPAPVADGIDDLIVAVAETEPDVAEPAPVADGIDDLIVAVAETEPDMVEPAPVAEGIDDLIAAVAEPGSDHLAQDHLTSAADPRALDDAVCLAYISTPTGYRLVPLAVELPAPGESIELGELGQLVVSRVGKSPLPLDRRVCVYVEQPLAPASTLLPA
jgi:hypothetical protein